MAAQKSKPRLVWVVAEAAEIVGDGVLVAGRHRGGVAGTNLAGFVFGLTAQLQLKLVHIIENLRVELLDQRRIAGETSRIKPLHLLDELIDLALRFGIVLKLAAKRAEAVGLLLNGALQIAGIHRGAWRDRLRQLGIVAGVDIAIIAIAAAVAATEGGAESATRAVAIVHAAGLIIAAAILRVGALA